MSQPNPLVGGAQPPSSPLVRGAGGKRYAIVGSSALAHGIPAVRARKRQTVVGSTAVPHANPRVRSRKRSRTVANVSAPGAPVMFHMRGQRVSNGATVHWFAVGHEDTTGAQSPYPGDIAGASIVRE
jgi:hypothetical protein